MVPTFAHIQLLKAALARQIDGSFIPPTIATPAENLRQLPPQPGQFAVSSGERLMTLYDSLRQQAWLKKLFSARRNTDLLPLAEILLALSDELTQAMLPDLQQAAGEVGTVADARWQAALQTLSPRARTLLSDEAQLVWSIWQTQLDANDAIVLRMQQLMQLANQTSHLAARPLCWISPVAPDAIAQAFLDARSRYRNVSVITLDWQAQTLDRLLLAAWPEVQAEESSEAAAPIAVQPRLADLSLHASANLESEALFCAQTIVDWLQQGKTTLAIVAQDRAVARRIRALLERADIFVADETGWKLSTTRAAAALAAWFELIAARADTVGLLDFLKSPFVLADIEDKAGQVMAIEVALRRANIQGGWQAIEATLHSLPQAQQLVAGLARQAADFSSGRKLCDWIALTQDTLLALGMQDALHVDAAGLQILQMLQTLAEDCSRVAQTFSFNEWRAFINLQMESTAFVQTIVDRRVVMLPLNGARLRSFDAVLMVGADADHLPSQPAETLFFANAVRRELGLATRETLQQQQLRDFAELLLANPVVVLSWQAHKNGEPNSLSPWIERLQLHLSPAATAAAADFAHGGSMDAYAVLPDHAADIPVQRLHATPLVMPAPSAPQLLPSKLSASGYNSLVACPYQFFATRMLGLSGIAELSDLPDKRDYGDWLHQILARFHQAMQQQAIAEPERAALLQRITDEVFGQSLEASTAALGYYERWQKTIPSYLAWVDEREQQGWTFLFGEEQLEKALHWADGEIVLHGRVDRIDADADGAQAVLDYKSASREALNKKLKQGEDHQLPFYGLLSAVPLHSASYVPLDAGEKKIQTMDAPDYQIWQQSLQKQIASNMQAIAHGAALPASGPETVCQYCEVRGLCRKGAW
jgi:ATP-dependent helicase/nuclease subunit B